MAPYLLYPGYSGALTYLYDYRTFVSSKVGHKKNSQCPLAISKLLLQSVR
jgi:hypothetical protein